MENILLTDETTFFSSQPVYQKGRTESGLCMGVTGLFHISVETRAPANPNSVLHKLTYISSSDLHQYSLRCMVVKGEEKSLGKPCLFAAKLNDSHFSNHHIGIPFLH